MPNEEIEYVTDEDESTYTGICYSKKISGYFYNKLSSITNNDDFTQAELTEYGLSETDGKIDISTTKKLINYLKSFVKAYVDTVNDNKVETSTYNTAIEGINSQISTINTNLNNIFDVVYPVGSIYMSVNNVDPAELFGGTWVKLEDKFLLGSGSRAVGVTGGVEKHTLTVNEMPKHTHTQNSHTHTQNPHNHAPYNYQFLVAVDVGRTTYRSYTTQDSHGIQYWYNSGHYALNSGTANKTATNKSTTATNQDTGGGQAHNNMPPFLTVHMWRRESLESL